MGFAITKNYFKNLKVFDKRCIIIWLQPVLGIHNLKDIHGLQALFLVPKLLFFEPSPNHIEIMLSHEQHNNNSNNNL